MFKQFRLILLALGFILAFGVGIWVGYQFLFKPSQKEIREEATVLLERIETVSKLITVEGYFSEIYNYTELQSYFGNALFGKKAMVKVRAKVSVGYDMENVKWTAIPENKVIRVEGLPEPEILSIDHTLDYYDLSEGYLDYFFDRFSEEDYNQINENAKTIIQQKAEESDLLKEAAQAGLERLDLIRFLVEGAGWTLDVDAKPSVKGLRRVKADSSNKLSD